MNRLEEVSKLVFSSLEEKCFGIKKQQAYQHLFGVSNLCMQRALQENIAIDIAGIMGVLHDIATYYYGSSFDHANRSAALAQEILIRTALFKETEVLCIVKAIKNHSHKETIDDIYSEVLKDSDVLYYHLYEPDAIFNTVKQQRLDTLKKKLLK